MRMFFRLAAADHLIAADANPAQAVPVPRRLPNTRRVLTNPEMQAINHVVVTTAGTPRWTHC